MSAENDIQLDWTVKNRLFNRRGGPDRDVVKARYQSAMGYGSVTYLWIILITVIIVHFIMKRCRQRPQCNHQTYSEIVVHSKPPREA